MMAAYRQTHSPRQVAWSEGRRPLGAVLHSSSEQSELSRWPFGHDDSTLNIVLGFITIIFIINDITIITKFSGRGVLYEKH